MADGDSGMIGHPLGGRLKSRLGAVHATHAWPVVRLRGRGLNNWLGCARGLGCARVGGRSAGMRSMPPAGATSVAC